LLNALDLAGIPLHAADRPRRRSHLVIVGGHAAFNPEPIADFIDAAIVGDGEQAVLQVTDVIADWKRSGRRGAAVELLLRLARTGNVYVPSFYDVSYLPDGRIRRVAPNRIPGCRGGSPSTRSWTSTSGPTRSSRWSRWPRRSTSG
jgi:radical SAM superfamily enzyme YgiQ (UPF0313 family)